MKKIFLIIAAVFAAAGVWAEVYMPGVFNDGMVLQREMPLKFWGRAAAGAEVKVCFAGLGQIAKADENGFWRLYLPPLAASKESRVLQVFENGKPAKEFKDVLVGEVWVLGGQSNMDWAISKTSDYESLLKNRAAYGSIRLYQIGNSHSKNLEFETGKGARWENLATIEDISKWPGTGTYFAVDLQKALDVPVGVMRLCQSGTPMFVWIPEAAQRSAPFLSDVLKKWQASIDNYDYQKDLQNWRERRQKWLDNAEKLRLAGKPVPEMSSGYKTEPRNDAYARYAYPGWLFNARVAPVAGYAARGVLWYQGEGDSPKDRAVIFKENFTLLIAEWRKAWGNEKLPFLFVQLAAHYNDNDWPAARQAQYETYKSVRHTQIAIIPDMGDETEIHFPQKKALAARLCNLALRTVYGRSDISAYGPFYKNIEIKGESAVVALEDFGRGVKAKEGKDPANLSGFEVKTQSGAWVAALAKLNDGRIEAAAAGVPQKISAVRYLWKNWCLQDVSVLNNDGLPLAPFTTE